MPKDFECSAIRLSRIPEYFLGLYKTKESKSLGIQLTRYLNTFERLYKPNDSKCSGISPSQIPEYF